MSKLLKQLFAVLFILGGSIQAIAIPNNTENTADVNTSKVDKYIRFVYDKISFKKIQKLDYATFYKAYYGYLNIKEAGKVQGNALLTICDFSLSSNVKRMWVIDLAKKKVLFNNLVAHGMGSGEEFATRFSNTHESHQSSLGFYVTGETYQGENGYSCKLHGIDGAWNNNAFDRAVVIHGADYVSNAFASGNNRIGRSHGCPALPRELNGPIINKVANGSVLFIYHPTKSYLRTTYWLNNKVNKLPQEASFLDLIKQDVAAPRWVETAAKPADSLLNKRIVKKNKQEDELEVLKQNSPVVVKSANTNAAGNKGESNTFFCGTTVSKTSVSEQANTNKPANTKPVAKEATREKEFLYIK
jgi:hypothetical protein